MQLTKFSKLKIIHTPGKNLSVADLLGRSFTKEELQINQLKHIKNMTLTPFLLIMVQTNFHYVLMTKETTL